MLPKPPALDSLRTPPDSPLAAANQPSNCPARVDIIAPLCGQQTVQISRNRSSYRLQAMRLGKLILTQQAVRTLLFNKFIKFHCGTIRATSLRVVQASQGPLTSRIPRPFDIQAIKGQSRSYEKSRR